ncbi:UPF0158 family protein [Rhabdochlamydiaceae symbiont of Dictyostelium giganteum]|uniref:UPF0158 family protein n=1 Tax=Rhabdochlamydiaceae symbiont of Dictyostelium giganteum TaxID=3342349 RepID=UPI00384AB642
MKKNAYPVAQNPLILRFHRLIDAFAKSDDERDFYLDRVEGFILYADLDKGQKELDDLNQEVEANPERYTMIPKMTFYESKKFMEGFANEKVYDVDTKEKLLDLIQSKEARENFLEFIYDHLSELEKWQQYYVERMRIRLIEWLRVKEFNFVFEEDLDLPKNVMEKVKQQLFDVKVSKDVVQARDALSQKAKTYYSSEALNPRPKRGRPPKQQVKVEVEPQLTGDIFTTVPASCRTFLYLPDNSSATAAAFSSRYDSEADLMASLRGTTRIKVDTKLESLSQRLESLKQLSHKLSQSSDVVGAKEARFLKAVAESEHLDNEERSAQTDLSDLIKNVSSKAKKSLEKSVTPEPKKKK